MTAQALPLAAPDADTPSPPPVAVVDAGASEVTAVVGQTGVIQIAADSVGAYFSEDDTIVRAVAAPECVAYLRSVTKPHSAAGTLTVTSDRVGQPGGPLEPLVMEPSSAPDAHNAYSGYPGPLETWRDDAGIPNYEVQTPFFPQYPDPRASTRVQLALSGSVVFPALAVTTLRSSPADIEVTEPSFSVEEVAAELAGLQPLVHGLSRAEPLVVGWELLGSEPEAVVLWVSDLSVEATAGGLPVTAELYCRWPAAARRGVVPASLLGAIHARLGTGPANGNMTLVLGDGNEVATAGASYFMYLFEQSNLLGTDCGLLGPPCVRGSFINAVLQIN